MEVAETNLEIGIRITLCIIQVATPCKECLIAS
jgi:hypothetical protein